MILLGRLEDHSVLPAEPLITTITLAEFTVGPLGARDDQERAARQAHLQLAEASFVPLPFDAAAARAFGKVAPDLRRSGRKTVARAVDAMIAAIAISATLPVYTCNAADFTDIDDLELVAVPHPDRPRQPRPSRGGSAVQRRRHWDFAGIDDLVVVAIQPPGASG